MTLGANITYRSIDQDKNDDGKEQEYGSPDGQFIVGILLDFKASSNEVNRRCVHNDGSSNSVVSFG